MSRRLTVRFLVTVTTVLICLSGCQQQNQERNYSSFKFVDTTKKKTAAIQLERTVERPVLKPAELKSSTKVKAGEVDQRASRIKNVLDKKRVEYVTVTGYCPCAKCCGWRMNRYGTPVYNYGPNRGRKKKVGYTSTGAKADVGTIAADIRNMPYGTKIYVPGYGFGEVKDTGGLIKGNHIDLYFNSHSEAKEWGVKYLKVAVWSPENQ